MLTRLSCAMVCLAGLALAETGGPQISAKSDLGLRAGRQIRLFVTFVDQFGRTGLGGFTVAPAAQLPPFSHPPLVQPLTVFVPDAAVPAPLFVPSPAAPGLIVFDPAPLTLTLPPPPPNR